MLFWHTYSLFCCFICFIISFNSYVCRDFTQYIFYCAFGILLLSYIFDLYRMVFFVIFNGLYIAPKFCIYYHFLYFLLWISFNNIFIVVILTVWIQVSSDRTALLAISINTAAKPNFFLYILACLCKLLW